jgi:hypothetical protein
MGGAKKGRDERLISSAVGTQCLFYQGTKTSSGIFFVEGNRKLVMDQINLMPGLEEIK